MAPDLSSSGPAPVPDTSRSSRSTALSNNHAMAPPAAPGVRHMMSSTHEEAGVPLRHPRPLTAAELYLECEKEQEAVVNRLTRELTALRAQTSSVASNASGSSVSTSTSSLLPVDISDPNPAHQLTGPTHPTPSRHRSNSSVSGRSIATPSTSHVPYPPARTVSQASIDRAAAAPGTLSRQPSVNASGASTPARRSVDFSRHTQQVGATHILPHRPSLSRDASYTSQGASSTHAQAGTPAPIRRAVSPSVAPNPNVQAAMQHLSEATAYRTEMEIVKAENEALRQRVKALERALRTRRRGSSQSDQARHDNAGAARPENPHSRQSRDAISPLASSVSSSGAGIAAWAAGSGVGGVAGPRERSESQSTTASSRRGLPPEDDIRLGESAASVSIPRSS